MKILVASVVFAPSIGGMETVAGLLVRGLTDGGHTVTVITFSATNAPDKGSVVVFRKPSLLRTLRCVFECEAVIYVGLTLRLGWPLFFLCRKALVSHHGYPPPKPGCILRLLRAKLANRANHIACSRAVATSVGRGCSVVGNPYEDRLFTVRLGLERTGELVFLGRLTREKGPDVLLEALAILAQKGIKPGLTVAGHGPLRSELDATAKRLGIADQVQFVGPVVGESLVALLNRHRILVVPSSWDEPFGLVALEGIACGCAVVGSSGGGLPDAIGPCGVTFQNRNKEQLAAVIESLLHNPEIIEKCRIPASEHLRQHSSLSVAHKYLEYLRVN
jgi:glycogen(starch) synthase